jgi:hypothetical protein
MNIKLEMDSHSSENEMKCATPKPNQSLSDLQLEVHTP